MLQNRYGDREFPVRDRWSNARLYRELAKRRNPSRAALRNVIWVLPAMLVLFATGADLIATEGAESDKDTRFLIALGVFVVLTAIGLTIGMLVDRAIPRREQERYRALTGTPDLTERQQQLLALDAQSDFSIGGWNSSLDYGPAWSMLPTELRQRAEHDPKRLPFVTLPLFEVKPMRARLDADQHIASSGDVELFVADALSDASLSARFRRVLHGPDGERMLARMASLTGVSQWDLRALDEPADGKPSRLLWAADAQRVISIVRMAYLAEHVDAAEAWRLIERAAQPATGLFSTWEAYWTDVRIGLAFFSDRLEVVQQFDETLAGLQASTWPAASVPFPAGPVPPWLPTFSVDTSSTADGQG